MLYLQWYLLNFQKLFFAERRGRWLLWLRISWAQTFSFCYSNVTAFPTSWKCKNFNFSFTLYRQNAISPEVFNEFSKTFFWLKEQEGRYCLWKFQVHKYFRFPIATLHLFRNPKNVKISIFSPYTVPAEILYFQKYLTNFQKLFLAQRRGRWLLWLKISSAQTFSFCYSNVTTFPSILKM